MVTQNKTLHFSKCVNWITILYGGIPQQVLGSTLTQRSNIIWLGAYRPMSRLCTRCIYIYVLITPERERTFHEWWYYYAESKCSQLHLLWYSIIHY